MSAAGTLSGMPIACVVRLESLSRVILPITGLRCTVMAEDWISVQIGNSEYLFGGYFRSIPLFSGRRILPVESG